MFKDKIDWEMIRARIMISLVIILSLIWLIGTALVIYRIFHK